VFSFSSPESVTYPSNPMNFYPGSERNGLDVCVGFTNCLQGYTKLTFKFRYQQCRIHVSSSLRQRKPVIRRGRSFPMASNSSIIHQYHELLGAYFHRCVSPFLELAVSLTSSRPCIRLYQELYRPPTLVLSSVGFILLYPLPNRCC